MNPLPEVTCPEDQSVCVDEAAFLLTGGSPEGGEYSGTGVSDGMFDAATAGVGVHTIVYSYTDENGCSNSCEFEITVNPLPEVTCPEDQSVCVDEGCIPSDGWKP
ncbi:MAG: HYR domain-containing protein [Saprospirales bacterium]|nr:HYR domain-containing protein [Saprospirales bacterium]